MKSFSTVFLRQCVTLCLVGGAVAGVADPKVDSYADPTQSREGHLLTEEQVNSVRLYDFYQRQADYFMAQDEKTLPELLPAYPGLDAGEFGHWGKHNQNNHKDSRLSLIHI